MRNIFNRFKSDPNAIDAWGYTRLHRAIMDGDSNKVRSLLEKGANPNLTGAGIRPPLLYALQRRNYPIALELVKSGADVNAKDSTGSTPLHIVVKQNQELFALALLKHKADPDVKDNAGLAPLHYVPPKSPGIVEIFAAHKANLSVQDNNGSTPLHFFLSSPEMAFALLAGGAELNICNKAGLSSYMLMLEGRHLQNYPLEIQEMIVQKADLGSTNALGETLLHIAARLELEDTFLHLVDKAELSVRDANGNSVLHALVRTQNVRMMEELLTRAPKLVSGTNSVNLTPLGEMLKFLDTADVPQNGKWADAIRVLLNAKADPDSADENGRGLLHYAVAYDRPDLLEETLVKGANPNLADLDGKAALHYAIEQNNLRAMDVLLDRGANPDMTDPRGWTILDRLAESGDRDSPRVQRLIVAGGQYNKQLPLYPEMMRRPKRIDKGPLQMDKTAAEKPAAKPATKPAVKKTATGRSGPKL